jgi:hypothetical protein
MATLTTRGTNARDRQDHAKAYLVAHAKSHKKEPDYRSRRNLCRYADGFVRYCCLK